MSRLGRQFGVRVRIERSAGDSFLCLKLRGPREGVTNAKRHIEMSIQEDPELLEIDESLAKLSAGLSAPEPSREISITSRSASESTEEAMPPSDGTKRPSCSISASTRLKTQVLRLPRAQIGKLLGRGGATIKDLRDRSQATIHVDKDERVEATVTVSGEEAAVMRAMALIEECLHVTASNPETGLSSPSSLEEVFIPKARVGAIIGAGGAVIKALRAESGAEIQIVKNASGDAIATIRGAAAAVQRARQAVNEIIAA